MYTFISILRGINVSGQKIIKMDDLRKLYEGLNFTNVRTYIQSGNVIFGHTLQDLKHLEMQIEEQILQKFGFQVPVMVKEINDLKNIVKENPYSDFKEEGLSKLHVTFLGEKPDQIYIDKIKEREYNPDQFIIIGKAVYLFCPNGYGQTKLTNNFFENKLKVKATTRNWRTVNELIRVAEAG